MKRLLAYLFIVLGLGLTFNVNAEAVSGKGLCINGLTKGLSTPNVTKLKNINEIISGFGKCPEKEFLSKKKYPNEYKKLNKMIGGKHRKSKPFSLMYIGYVIKDTDIFIEYNKEKKKLADKKSKTQIAKAEPSQTQKVVENSFICLNKKGNSYTPYFRSGPKCKKYNDIEVLERDEWYWVVRMPVSERSNPSYSKMMKIHHPKLFNSIMKNKNLIVKAEPSQTQKVAKKDIKFCVYKNSAYITNVTSEKYKITRFDNPYLTCDSNFIIDSNYKDELFYTYLVDTIGIVESRGFRTLEPAGNWKPKNPIKPKKKVKVAKDKEPKQEEFKPKKTNQDNEAPVITIAEAITVNDTDYEFQGKVTDQAKTIYVEVDGRPTDVKNGKFIVKGYSPIDKQISIEAIDQWGNRSEPKIVKLTIDIKDTSIAEKLEPLNPSKIRSKSSNNKVALIIGIENYLESPNAKYANLDAKYFFDYARKGFGVKKQNINLLVDEQATFVKTNKALTKWLRSKIKSGQSDLIIFFAGHGLASSDGKELYLLPQDSDPDLLARTALSRTELFQEIINLNPKSVTMFLDTCYSGVSRDEKMLLASARPIRIIADEQSEIPNNFTIFSASKLDQISSGLKEANHGIFSYYLMKGLEGKADSNQDKKITNGELLAYMDLNVSQKASELGRQQNPSLAGDPNKVLMSYR